MTDINILRKEFAAFCAEDKLTPYSPPTELQSVFDSYHWIAQDRIDAVRQHFLPGRNIEIYFDFSSGPNLNAAAGIRNKRGIFRINKGAVLVSADLFQRMLSHPDVLKFIGNVGLESYEGQFSEGLLNNIDVLHASRIRSGWPTAPRSPNDPVRREFSMVANNLAYDFLVLHEVAHIVTGQLEFIIKAAGVDMVCEAVSGGAAFYRSKTVRQAIELGADNFAVGLGFTSVMNWSGPVHSHWESFFSTPEQRIYAWCFAIGAVFRLWGLETNIVDVRKRDYPPPAMRYFAAIGTIQLMFETSKTPIKVDFKKIADQAFVDLNESIFSVGGRRLKTEDFNQVYTPEGKTHFLRIRRCMARLLPRLRYSQK
ncbi:MAG: hypothetical protein ABSB42_00900 [Tepidisphaeraceae bacterium]|jgi:hypothetical protein